MRVLLIEDDMRLADVLASTLRGHGYDVTHVATAQAALDADPCDIVLLDLGLPDRDGISLCRALRERGDTGIIAVTARGRAQDRVRGLRAGADDYVVKPFAMEELRARIEAVGRRVRGQRPPRQQVGPLEFDRDALEVSHDGASIQLTRKESQLLAALAREPGAVVSKQRLLIEVWNTDWQGNNRTLEVHIATLRSKLGGRELIETVRGVGYRLNAS
ncbi:response regulator transcription factor [Spiractinospora alimapuensis]|uniref:response regulator transcription factor n=1 Tax=Spiractinospora alimapuensis TaxID=2820884 RepID=UPI001F22CA0C|nr:response regulator transcription factor [Spiractinospora alimapuensis]QVQ50067.1 response regulator transcription factor [Spiractinospora alimapuensis]